MKEHDLTLQCSNFLEDLGRFSEAADVRLSDGDVIKAVTLFLTSGDVDRAGSCLVESLWSNFSFGVNPVLDSRIKVPGKTSRKYQYEKSKLSDLVDAATELLGRPTVASTTRNQVCSTLRHVSELRLHRRTTDSDVSSHHSE